tara:strand:- start:167 stop:388 length:222 start_codon:yes stop_codon:yes gene_type:complete
MQKEYFHNFKAFTLKDKKKAPTENIEISVSQRVDVNKLLNRIKINESNKKKENFLLLGIGTFIVAAISIIILV